VVVVLHRECVHRRVEPHALRAAELVVGLRLLGLIVVGQELLDAVAAKVIVVCIVLFRARLLLVEPI
jgi:hypothetical protein